jgi:predicted phage terminase large subunit-like protein
MKQITKIQIEKAITVKIITGDTAFKEKDSADWSVFQCWGIIGISGLALMDEIRGRWGFPDLVTNAKNFWDKHTMRQSRVTPATEFWIEDKASGISLVQTLIRDIGMKYPNPKLLPIRAWVPKKGTSPDKVGRARQSTMPFSCGRILIPNPNQLGYRWVKSYQNEMESFSADMSHLFDDRVDTTTMAVLIWIERGGGVGPLPFWMEN